MKKTGFLEKITTNPAGFLQNAGNDRKRGRRRSGSVVSHKKTSLYKKNLEENWVEDLSLVEAMRRLPERERHIIDMRFFEGKTQMEIASEIGISQAQVSRLEKGAIASMKRHL